MHEKASLHWHLDKHRKNTEKDVHLNITDFYLHYKTKIVHSKTSTYKKKHCMTFKHLSKSTKRCYKSESLLRVTQILRPAPEARRLLVTLVRINKLHQNISGAVYKKRSTWAEKTKGCTVVCIFLVVQSQCDLGHIKQRKDVKKKAMWNVQCIEVWRATFMTSPPVSPVRWLENKRKKVLLGVHFGVRSSN